MIISLRFISLLALIIPLLSFAQTGKYVKIPASANYVKGEMILKVKPQFRNKLSTDAIQLPSVLLSSPHLKIQKIYQLFPGHEVPENARSKSGEKMEDLSTIYSISFDPGIPVEDAINALWTEDVYDFIEPRYINTPFLTPNDPNPNNLDIGAFTLINAYNAWDLVTGSHSVLCGIVDTGYKFGVADMDGNLVANPGEIAGNGIDDDVNGYIDDVYGWDFAGNDNTLNGTVTNPHGYLVSTRFGNVTNNGTLYAGVGYNCGFRIMKAAPNESSITHGYEGIVYAADNGMHVINCSWGSPNYTAFGEAVVNYATINKNAAVIVAGGNSQSNLMYFPAAFRRSISVGACSATGVVNTTFSSYNYTMDINSPNKGGYTSNAAPVVTGAVALTYRRYHDILGMASFTPYQAAQRVRVTAVDNYGINPVIMADKLGKGRLDMFNAVNNVSLTPSVRINNEGFTTISGDGDAEIESGETIQLNLDFINWLDAAGNLTITIAPDAVCAPYISMITGVQNPGALALLGTSSQIFSFSVSPAAPADLAVNLKVSYSDPVTGYTDFEYIMIEANPNAINVTNNLMDITVTGTGGLGYRDYPFNNKGMGLQYNGLISALYEGGFLIGNSSAAIANNVRVNSSSRDNDFAAISRILANPAPANSDFEANATFSDGAAPSPLGLTINMNIYNYNAVADQDYLIVEYLITNSSGVARNGLYAGIFTDWDIYSNPLDSTAYAQNLCNYDAAKKMSYAHQSGYSDYYAVALLTDDPFKSRAYSNSSVDFTDNGKFNAISNTPAPASASITSSSDIMQFTGAGSFDIPSGGTHRLAFAIIGGNSLAALNTSRLDAIKNYFGRIVGSVPVNTALQSVINADMEETDAEGWTYYYKSGVENQLLLSLKKDNTVSITPAQVTLGFGGSPYYTQITAPTAPYAANYPTGWYVMNRFWDVSPAVQPVNPVGVRFYYTPQDFTALQANCPALVTDSDIQFFKFTSASGINPNPASGHTGANYTDLIGINADVVPLGDNHYGEFTVGSFSGGGAGETGNGVSFPVQWLDFSATLMENQTVKLEWATASESLNEYFTVEKSVDGISFMALEQVPGTGNSYENQFYSAYDLHPDYGTNYYRIRQTDIDGHNTFSETKRVLLSQDKVVHFVVAPNPTTGNLSITLIGEPVYYSAKVVNVLGETVAEIPVTNDNIISLNLSHCTPGIYYLMLTGNGFSRKQSVWLK